MAGIVKEMVEVVSIEDDGTVVQMVLMEQVLVVVNETRQAMNTHNALVNTSGNNKVCRLVKSWVPTTESVGSSRH